MKITTLSAASVGVSRVICSNSFVHQLLFLYCFFLNLLKLISFEKNSVD